jgi:hypothetical protein
MGITGKRTSAAVAAASTVLLLSAGPAFAAKLDAGDVEAAAVEEVEFAASPASGTGNYISCLSDERAVSGGATFHKVGQDPSLEGIESSWITSNTVTGDEKGWYADAETTSSGHSLTVRALCVPKSLLSRAKLRERTAPIPHRKTKAVQVSCRKGEQLVNGGSFIRAPGEGPTANNAGYARVSASFPTGNGWAAGVRSFAPVKFVEISLTAYAWCLPDGRIKDVHVTKHTVRVGAGDSFLKQYGCPGKQAVLHGGAYIHRPGKSFASGLKSGVLAGQVPRLPAGSKWLSAGGNYTEGKREVTTRVLCLEA